MRQKAMVLLVMLALLAPGCSKNVQSEDIDSELQLWQLRLKVAKIAVAGGEKWLQGREWPEERAELKADLERYVGLTRNAVAAAEQGIAAWRAGQNQEDPSKLIDEVLKLLDELEPLIGQAIDAFTNTEGAR